MRELVGDVLLALVVTGMWALLCEARKQKEARLYCDDDGELLPITVVDETDRRAN